ncbi:MAG: two pore domain potassium channel family protein [Actinobacteria bacterium]|nr:two pore domain potassium channel family protein [Actinomycetota bacterium]
MNAIAVVAGLALVVWMLLDTFDTLLATNLRSGRVSFTRLYYRYLWKLYRPICVRLRRDDHRERWLARFGPSSFVGLLVLWVFLEITGWSLVWWGLRNGFDDTLSSFSDAWYYAGVVYFSVGFGDIVPVGGVLRVLTVLGAMSGLATLGLVIGFLPTLNAAYSARERQLLLLDDLGESRITPISLVQALVDQRREAERLWSTFDQWSAWCADVYDSHTSLPMLMWFRSKHPGNSWITGLGVVADAAAASVALVPDTERGSAIQMHRQAVRLIHGLGDRIGLEPKADWTPLPEELWRAAYDLVEPTELPLRPFDESYALMCEMRDRFHPMMEAFMDELLAPRGFWGPTTADDMVAAPFDELREELFGDPDLDI